MIKQVIIVEGKTDTQKLKNIFGEDLKIIETNGLALNEQTISFIKKMNDNYGVIIFTDPDGPGKKIREKIINELDNKVLNAFITKQDINQKSKKIGIAEADETAIKIALNNLILFSKDANESLSWSQYLNNDFYLKNNRLIITKFFGWNEKLSSKTLFKWLNWSQLTQQDIEKIIGGNNGN